MDAVLGPFASGAVAACASATSVACGAVRRDWFMVGGRHGGRTTRHARTRHHAHTFVLRVGYWCGSVSRMSFVKRAGDYNLVTSIRSFLRETNRIHSNGRNGRCDQFVSGWREQRSCRLGGEIGVASRRSPHGTTTRRPRPQQQLAAVVLVTAAAGQGQRTGKLQRMHGWRGMRGCGVRGHSRSSRAWSSSSPL